MAGNSAMTGFPALLGPFRVKSQPFSKAANLTALHSTPVHCSDIAGQGNADHNTLPSLKGYGSLR